MISENPPQNGDFNAVGALEAAFDWWREAGVDLDYRDAAASWLAEPESPEAVAAPKPAARVEEPRETPLQRAFAPVGDAHRIGGDQGSWPKTLAEFREWWLIEPSLADAGCDGRLPPRGVAGARLMLLIAEPYGDDGTALLSGHAGRMAEAILRAMGIAPHEAYMASALPAASTLADWGDLARRGLATVTRHHLALAAPERLLVFGRGLAPLFDIAPRHARTPATIEAGGRDIPLLLAPDLDELSRSPERRRNFWNNWLAWTA